MLAIAATTPSGLERLERVALGAGAEPLTDADRTAMVDARAVVEAALEAARPVYGVTTGFGAFSSVVIPRPAVDDLQLNIVRSHAVATGEPLPTDETRAMLLLLADSLRRGHSGVRVAVVELLLDLLDRGVLPVIPSRGSVGASGDLAPLSHVALVLVGEGEARYGDRVMPGGDALRQAGLSPLRLTAKEGLALLNGTHLMAAVGGLAVRRAQRVLDAAVVATALSVDALKGSRGPYDRRISAVRRQPGQIAVAGWLWNLLEGSEIRAGHADCERVQDPYSLRCAPAVLGAIADALEHVAGTFERETDAVTDNPLVFAAEHEVVSGGNFHGQPLALAADHLALAMTQVAGFSERRVYALLSPGPADLPPFLAPEPGVTSGLMITQYVCASLVNECHVLAHPSSASSLPTSAGMEDWNSMGAAGALKARTVVEHAAHVVACELACAAHALQSHRPLRSSPALEQVSAAVLEHVPPLTGDRSVAAELERLRSAVLYGGLPLPG
jgi:histidine ammonia-lyase